MIVLIPEMIECDKTFTSTFGINVESMLAAQALACRINLENSQDLFFLDRN